MRTPGSTADDLDGSGEARDGEAAVDLGQARRTSQ